MAKKTLINSKWCAFARAAESGEYTNDADAYASVYPKAKPQSCMTAAYKLSCRPEVMEERLRIRELANHVIAVNVASLTKEFEEARSVALEERLPAAMVAATMGKARIHGLDKVTVKVEASEELTPWAGIEAGITTKDDI